MAGPCRLGCTEYAAPGRRLIDKLIFLRDRGMWLELANDETKEMREVMSAVRSTGARILSVQAYRLHDLQLLGRDRGEAEAALRHVFETMEMASSVGAENVVIVLGYGKPGIHNPREKCVQMFRHFSKIAEELGVMLSIEPLGSDRTVFMPGVAEVCGLIRDIGSENVRLVVDTMHVHNNGDDVVRVICERLPEISEIQLRDTDSRPPGQGSLKFGPIMKVIREKFRGLLCLEYRPGPEPRLDFENACRFISEVL